MSRSQQFAVPAAIAAEVTRSRREVAARPGVGESAATPTAAGRSSKPRDAVTVVLIRDTDTGVEVYLMRRAATMAAFSGMTVFPGGGVDAADMDPTNAVPWVGPGPTSWTQPLSAAEPLAAGLVCAAVRETFEEAGVLLAGSEHAVVDDVSGEDFQTARTDLEARRLSLAGLLRREDFALRADLLRPWAHWLTPAEELRRFDTRFLLATLPAGQRTGTIPTEATEASWVRPAHALDELARGERVMVPPTAMTLADLAEHDTVAGVFAEADRRSVRRVLPRLVPDENGVVRFLVPGDPGYDEAAPAESARSPEEGGDVTDPGAGSEGHR